MFVNVFFFYPVDLTSHFIKFRICLPVSFCVYAENKQTFLKISFMPYSTTKSIKNGPPKQLPKAIKDSGGAGGRHERGQRFYCLFFQGSLRNVE